MTAKPRLPNRRKQYPRIEGDYLLYRNGNLVSVRLDSLFAELLPPKIRKWLKGKRLKLKRLKGK